MLNFRRNPQPLMFGARLPLVVAALVAPGISQAAPAKLPATEHWSLIEGDPGDGIPKCMLFGRADRSTIIQLMTDAGHYGQIAVAALNVNWSIRDGDDLGEISFSSNEGRLTGVPVATERAFFYFVDAEEVATFFQSAKSGVQIERNGETIVRFRTGNLPEMIAKLQACGARLYARDPFARPSDQSSTENAKPASDPSEVMAVPPKPIDLGKWMGAIQRDYFSGPHYHGPAAEFAHKQRNSRPASLKFRMVVDEHGKMVQCEVLEANGHQEWSWLFCSLAKKHPLQFTPALSSAGSPMPSEYVTTAVVAFN